MCQEFEYTVRVLESLAEFEEIGRLQQAALGIPEDAIFPPKLIYVANENGGAAVCLPKNNRYSLKDTISLMKFDHQNG